MAHVVDDLSALELAARRVLENPAYAEPRGTLTGYRPELRLWDYPAFGEVRSWTVFLPTPDAAAGALPAVREVVWDRRADVARLADPDQQLHIFFGLGLDPTLRVADGTLPPRPLATLLADLREILAGDGARPDVYGLACGSGLPSIDPQWWCDRPADWERLATWFAAAREMVVGGMGPV